MARGSLSKEVISNQVFIGCPWRIVRKKYLDVTENLKKKFPLHFVIVGSEVAHTAEDLLNFIKSKMETSSGAIFDVPGGNPNVSLEFGYAEGRNIESALYISTHGKATSKSTGSTIISDLAGKRRKEYKNEKSLTRLMTEFSKNHPYTIKFEKEMRCCRDLCWNWVTRSPAFREYRVRPRGQLADRWMFWQASANRQPFAC